MNFTQTFDEFSAGLAPMDLFLYAGIGIVLWVLFKDKLSPVQEFLMNIVGQIKEKTKSSVDAIDDLIPSTNTEVSEEDKQKALFFDLIISWKQTRDLAERSGCQKAVDVADEMFPYLSPTICGEENEE